jgi:hypothetical protein
MYILQVKQYNSMKWRVFYSKERKQGEIINMPNIFIKSSGEEIRHGFVVYNGTSARLYKNLREAREAAIK